MRSKGIRRVIELAVHIALGGTLLAKCSVIVEFKTVKVVAAHLRNGAHTHSRVWHISRFDI